MVCWSPSSCFSPALLSLSSSFLLAGLRLLALHSFWTIPRCGDPFASHWSNEKRKRKRAYALYICIHRTVSHRRMDDTGGVSFPPPPGGSFSVDLRRLSLSVEVRLEALCSRNEQRINDVHYMSFSALVEKRST